jgi:hypothetical protein
MRLYLCRCHWFWTIRQGRVYFVLVRIWVYGLMCLSSLVWSGLGEALTSQAHEAAFVQERHYKTDDTTT